MVWDNLLIHLVLIGASFLVWKTYDDQPFRWLFCVAVILAGAFWWQYLIENILPVPEYVQMGSLIAVQILRLIFIAMFALVGIRAIRSKPLTPTTENIIIAGPAVAYVAYVLFRLFV